MNALDLVRNKVHAEIFLSSLNTESFKIVLFFCYY